MNPIRHLPLIPLLFALLASTPATHAIIVSYNYDVAGRLNAVNYNGTSRTAYAYDKNGNLLSRINTVNTPLPPLAGTYNGLLTNTGADLTNIGPITLKIGINGSFSGKITIGGSALPFTGTFPASGVAPVIIIDRKPPLNDLTLTLTLDVVGGTKMITGTVTDGTFTSDVMLDRAGYNATTQLLPAGLMGKYTSLLMPTDSDPAIPQGDGYATVAISNTGMITMTGKLANNVGITHSAPMVGVANWPLFISLHTNKGYLTGLVTFASNPSVSDFFGVLDWRKPITTGILHPAAFDTDLNFVGSKWDVPLKGQRALNFANTVPNATFTATEGNLAAPVIVNVTLDTANKFIMPLVNPSKLKLTLTATSGVVMGSFVDGTKTRTVSGVLFQEQNIGSGFFPGTDVSGLIQIEANP